MSTYYLFFWSCSICHACPLVHLLVLSALFTLPQYFGISFKVMLCVTGLVLYSVDYGFHCLLFSYWKVSFLATLFNLLTCSFRPIPFYLLLFYHLIFMFYFIVSCDEIYEIRGICILNFSVFCNKSFSKLCYALHILSTNTSFFTLPGSFHGSHLGCVFMFVVIIWIDFAFTCPLFSHVGLKSSLQILS